MYTSDGLKITGLLERAERGREISGGGFGPRLCGAYGLLSRIGCAGVCGRAGVARLYHAGARFRGYEESDHGMNLFLSGFIADAINAGNALKQYPQVDAEHMGLWGHSMGGGVATRVMVVSDLFDAAVLYAPLSANMEEMLMDPFTGEPQGVTDGLMQGVINALDDPQYRAGISPENFFDWVKAPISIHVGTADSGDAEGMVACHPRWAESRQQRRRIFRVRRR